MEWMYYLPSMQKAVERLCTNSLGEAVVNVDFFLQFFKYAVSDEHSEDADYII